MVTTGWLAFVLAALKALPALISLIQSIKGSAEAAKNQGIGYDKAVKDSLETAAARVKIARDVEIEAEKDHAAKADDSAFDQDFRR
jgi:hypothetical protein